jgi:glycosyltransferase involved in cell wall biosynthesis
MSALVSVVMPVYAPRPDWLRVAVTSALDDDCPLELVVVDDGNDEPVAPLLADIGDERLRVVRIAHAGPYEARNAGLAASGGTHVRFVDADDRVEPGSTGRLLALAGEDETAIAYGATLMCDDELRPQRTVTSALEGDVAVACVCGRFEVFVVSLLFPRAAVERAGGWVGGFAVSGDWDFVLRAVEQAPVRSLDAVVTHYRRHASSITKSADVAAGAAAGRRIIDRYFERHPEQRGTRVEHDAYARLHLDRARAHAARGESRPAAAQLARAARHDPGAALRTGAGWTAGRLRAFTAAARRRARRAR